MATQVKTFAFLSNAENLAAVGANMTMAWDSASGSPANGSIDITGTAINGTLSERFRQNVAGSWEAWGVPAGATVTAVQCTAYKYNHWGTGVVSYRKRIRVVNSSGTTVHSAGELIDETPALSPGATWRAGSVGMSRAVDSTYQASSTDVRLEVVLDVADTAAHSIDHAYDTIELTITYSTAPTTQVAVPVADISIGSWLAEPGDGTTNLYAQIDESVADAADWVQSSQSPTSADIYKMRLAPTQAPLKPRADSVFHYKVNHLKDIAGGDTIQLTVKLYAADGTTLIKSWTPVTVGDTLTASDLTLTGAEADTIPDADFATGLVLSLEVIKV